MFVQPPAKPNFNELELALLKWWKDTNVLDRSIDQRPMDNAKTFYDGPITANGEPHYGHMLTFAMKDIIPRYWTMQGYHVERSLGWDCQGIPVEYEVEKKLGFKEKKDIEKFGVAKFNQLCRESVLEFRGQIIELEERMGRLTNDREEYYTMDAKFIESIWWSLKELFDKGLLYEGFKVVPYSTRAGTSLSNAEVALGGYKMFTDPAVTVEFPLKDDPKTILLAWTTTPWTMPGNLGLAVNPKLTYVKVKGTVAENTYIMAKSRVEEVFKGDKYEVLGEIKAEELIGKEYTPPFDFYAGRENAHKVYGAEYVTDDSGTGIVHLAPYGAEDNEVFQKVGIQSFDYLDDQGDFTSEVAPYAGLNYRDANPKIVEDLKAKDLLFREEQYEHEMPMCWRTSTPLIYKPITSWYIAMSKLRTELVDNNNKINWTPKHIGEGRFGNWLAEIKDWGISRLRYWGTPLPVWKSPSGKIKVIGSFAEIEKLSGKKIDDPHRPFVDDITFELDGETYTRIPDVIDVWYDSGAMPFARFHYPFENKEKFEQTFPAEYIAEGVDQTRGWFYSLHAISTALWNKESFKNVIVNGFTLDDHGAKQSKSKKNYAPYHELLEKCGADAVRFNFFTSPISAGEDSTISETTAKVQTQEFLLPLWNCFTYLITYANIHEWEPRVELAYNQRNVWGDEHPWDHIPFDDIENELDAWILAKLQNTIGEVIAALDTYDIPKASRSLKSLVDELSKWYIRRSRDRFAAGDTDALETLYYVLVEISKLAAPFVPFVSEYMYRELVASQLAELPESVHLTDFPVVDMAFLNNYKQILAEMEVVRSIGELGQSLRTTHGLKIRQPLSRLEVQFTYAADVEGVYLSDWMKDVICAELNVVEVADVPQLAENKTIQTIVSPSGTLAIGLETKLTPELAEEGLMREIIRSIQALRKEKGFKQGEKVKVSYDTEDKEVLAVLTKRVEDIKSAVSATEMVSGTAEHVQKVNGKELKLSLS